MDVFLHLVSALAIAGGLHFKQFSVPAAHACQLRVTSLFGDPAVVEYYDAICHSHGRESVRNKECHLSRGQFSKAVKNFELTAGVESRRRLIQDQELCIAQIGTSQGNLLPFAAGEIETTVEATA